MMTMTATTAELPEIVKRALVETVTDIGQLSKSDKYQLNKYVKRGWLSRGQGGPFPKLKAVYAHPGFDFAVDRQRHVAYAMAIHEYEKRTQTGPYHPMFTQERRPPAAHGYATGGSHEEKGTR